MGFPEGALSDSADIYLSSKPSFSSLPDLSLLFPGTVADMLILVNLLAESGDLVTHVFELGLYLLHTLRPGLAFRS